MLDVYPIETQRELAELEPAWDELVAASGEDNPFRRWCWNWTWWKHYGAGRKLAVLAARKDGQLVGLAPLFLEQSSRFATRTLRLLGSTDVCSEYLGLILRHGMAQEAAPALLEFLFGPWSRRWDVLHCTDLPAEGVELPWMESFVARRRLPVARRPGCTNLLVELPDSWDDFVASLTSKRRTKLRRIEREFQELPDAEFAVLEREQDFDPMWNELVTLHNRHWEQEGQKGRFTSATFENFHREVAAEYLRRGMLVLASLRVNGQAIASCYGFRLGNTVYEYQRGHDPQWIDRWPGHILQSCLFRLVLGLGVRRWDYLRGDYRNKRDWATTERKTVEFLTSSPRPIAIPRFYWQQTARNAMRIGRFCGRTAAALAARVGKRLTPSAQRI